MIEWITAELKRRVPEIKTILTGTNDAGAGLCWAAALYSGPNGPAHCRSRNAGVRVRDLMEAVISTSPDNRYRIINHEEFYSK